MWNRARVGSAQDERRTDRKGGARAAAGFRSLSLSLSQLYFLAAATAAVPGPAPAHAPDGSASAYAPHKLLSKLMPHLFDSEQHTAHFSSVPILPPGGAPPAVGHRSAVHPLCLPAAAADPCGGAKAVLQLQRCEQGGQGAAGAVGSAHPGCAW